MAGPALQCPECKRKHPVDEIPIGTRLFRCRACARVLKVPPAVLAMRGEAGPSAPTSSTGGGSSPVAAGEPTAAVPAPNLVDGCAARAGGESVASPPARSRVRRQRGPRALFRVFVWVLALAVGLVLAAGPLVVTGFLDVDRLFDVLSGEGFDRVKLPLLLIPLWAAFAATLAHVAIEWRARALAGRPSSPTGV